MGKKWFYRTIRSLSINLFLRTGYETAMLRDRFGLPKTSRKSDPTFASHAVDAWVMAADVWVLNNQPSLDYVIGLQFGYTGDSCTDFSRKKEE